MPSPEYLPFHKGASPARGHIVEEQIQVFDIMPTALELAGITPNRTHFATSLVPQLMGAKGDPDRVVYSDGTFVANIIDGSSKCLPQASDRRS
jgi:arylsulfatase A-like enzyme